MELTAPDKGITVGPVSKTEHSEPVSEWLHAYHHDHQKAARYLWGFLQERLIRFAAREVERSPTTLYDEEDVALSAFNALCTGLQSGTFPELTNRDELWRLLATITLNKARRRARDENRLKRGGQATVVNVDDGATLNELISEDPSPDLKLAMQEECERLLSILERDELRIVACLKVEGYTNDEISERMGCTRRATQRRLAIIREIWSEDLDQPEEPEEPQS